MDNQFYWCFFGYLLTNLIMNIKNCLLLLLILLFTACTNNDVRITGEAPGIKNAEVEIKGKGKVWIENIVNGRFKINAKIAKPDFYTLSLYFDGQSEADRKYFIYLEPGDYFIRFKPGKGAAYPGVVSGSALEDEVVSYYRLSEKLGEDRANDFFILHSPASILSAYLLTRSVGAISQNPEKYLKQFRRLSPEVKQSKYGRIADTLISAYCNNTIGAPMPPVAGLTPQRQPFDRNVLKGKLTLLAFWASWNYSSIKDIPAMKALYDQYHSKGFEIVSIAIDKHEDRWKKFIKYYKLNWLHAADFKGSYSQNFVNFNTDRLPYYILIGPDLKIIERDVPLESVEVYINDYLKGKR